MGPAVVMVCRADLDLDGAVAAGKVMQRGRILGKDASLGSVGLESGE